MRKPMVTRTIKCTKATVLCLNIATGEPFQETVVLPRTFKDEAKLMKACEAVLNKGDVKAVHPVYTTIEENLYGMSEQDFIENAEILPPRLPKLDNTEY